MKPSHVLLGLSALIAGLILWKIADARSAPQTAALNLDTQRYVITSTGTETILLDTASGESWQLKVDETGTSWSRLPAPGGVAVHKWGASPFTDVRFNGDLIDDSVTVVYDSQQYELVSISGFSTRTLLEQARHHFGSRPHQWQKGFAEDLTTLLKEMGTPAGDYVPLVLKDTTTDSLVTIDRAPMTKDNRQEVWHRRDKPRHE